MTKEHYIICDRNAVGLILLIHREKEVKSADLVKVNRNYSSIKSVAEMLLETGVLQTRKSESHSTKTYWTMTEKGERAANLLLQVEKDLRKK